MKLAQNKNSEMLRQCVLRDLEAKSQRLEHQAAQGQSPWWRSNGYNHASRDLEGNELQAIPALLFGSCELIFLF